MSLPPAYYVARQGYADAIAALTLLEPALAPSRDELPRDVLDFDPELQRLLSLVPLSLGKWEVLTALAFRELDRDYLIDIIRLADDLKTQKVFAYRSSWYVIRLLRLQEHEHNYHTLRQKARSVWEEMKVTSYE